MQNRAKPSDFADTLVLPQDELAARRSNKSPVVSASSRPREEPGLTSQQVELLLKAAEARSKSQ